MLSIASVHHKTDYWFPPQISFLSKYTKNYEYSVFLNNIENKKNFDKIKVIGKNEIKEEMHDSHVRGLKAIISYFKTTNSDYFLILDSDCFPFRDWQEYLLKKMEETSKKVAAIVRYEALSNLIHPSVVFFHRSVLSEINFHVLKTPDLCGRTYLNVTPDKKLPFYPLIRTNTLNVHPLFAGIYGNCFFHHGCGSREVVGDMKYHDISINESKKILEKINDDFDKNPYKFILKLNGKNVSFL